MFDAAAAALSHIASLDYLIPLLLGISIGFVIGLIPGLGGATGLAIMIPFVYGMDPFAGIALLIGMMAVNDTTCSFPAILLGVPGSGGSTATVLDGHPLARMGQGARALGASFSASLIGGLLGSVVLLAMVLGLQAFVPSLGSPTLLMLCLLGLAAIAAMVSGDVQLGLASAAIGLMLGTVGGAPAEPVYRYTFGELYLYNGIPIAVLAIGLYAVPEVIGMLVSRMTIARGARLTGSVFDGFKETWRNKRIVLQSSWLGTLAGTVPGLGGSVVDEMAYSLARGTVKDASRFGQGDIRGVIAPEAANNAKEGGGLIPTLVLGIPSGASTAILLGGLALMGVSAGPSMLTSDLDVTLTVVWTLVVANVIVTLVCLFAARWIARVTLVPGRILAPILMVIFLAAGFQATQNFGDIILILLIGVLAYGMKISGWPRVPLIVGFVLAPSLERYLHLSIARYEFAWITEPSVIGIGGAMIAFLIGIPLFRRYRHRKGGVVNKKAYL